MCAMFCIGYPNDRGVPADSVTSYRRVLSAFHATGTTRLTAPIRGGLTIIQDRLRPVSRSFTVYLRPVRIHLRFYRERDRYG